MHRNRSGTFDGGSYSVHVNFEGDVPEGFLRGVDTALSAAVIGIETTVIPEINELSHQPVLCRGVRERFYDKTQIRTPDLYVVITGIVYAKIDTIYRADIQELLKLSIMAAGAEASSQLSVNYVHLVKALRRRRDLVRRLESAGIVCIDGRTEGLGDLTEADRAVLDRRP